MYVHTGNSPDNTVQTDKVHHSKKNKKINKKNKARKKRSIGNVVVIYKGTECNKRPGALPELRRLWCRKRLFD